MEFGSSNTKILLVIAFSMMGFSLYNKFIPLIRQNLDNKPVTIPTPYEPNIENNILYDEFNEAKNLAINYNKKLLVIFGADWCPYCSSLKKNTDKLKQFDSYIICFINIDKNKELVKEYNIQTLPTSIIIVNNKEQSKIIGYDAKTYYEWLKYNNHGDKTWSNLSL